MSQVKTFGRYNLIRKVAQGGMAEIFLAKFQGIGGFEKKIIIKRILPRFSENQEFIKMLIHEAKTAVQLHHQNVVQIYDLGKVRDTYYISMEYIRGKDLRTVLNRLKSQGQILPQELAVFIAREICKGLDYAHNITDQHGEPLNLVHRDISPPNILLSLEGEVKIIDFGIAKATSQATDTQAGVFKGKFAYMAPEQASGLPVDRRADIFATTLILWEMLTCKKLLEAESDIATLERAKHIDAYPIPFRDVGIPDQLEHIIRRGLKQDRSTRYQSAGEMARDLTIYLNLKYPGFSETDLADFLRTLFNLDKRRVGMSGDLVTPGQGERSLTGSDFFRAFAQTGSDSTDPSVKLAQEAAKPLSNPLSNPPTPVAGVAAASVSTVAAAAVAAMPTQRKRSDGRAAGDGEYWALENEIRDEIEVFALGTKVDSESGEERRESEKTGWVSQLAEDFVRADDGTLHPLISTAMKAEKLDHKSDDAPTVVKPLSNSSSSASLHALAGNSQVNTGRPSGTVLVPPPPRHQPSWSMAPKTFIMALAGGTFLVLALMAIFAPNQLQSLRSSVGLVRKAQVELSFEPVDATLLINGQEHQNSTSPVLVTLPTGQRHVLTLRKQGFEEKQVMVDLVAAKDHPPVSVRLAPALPRGSGRIVLGTGIPSGANLFINNLSASRDDLQGLATGVLLKLRVEAQYYEPFQADVTLTDQPYTLNGPLIPKTVGLQLKGAPQGADVFVNGQLRGTCCPFNADNFIPNTPYSLTVKAEGYENYSMVWTPPVGGSGEVGVTLRASGTQSGSKPNNDGSSKGKNEGELAPLIREITHPAIAPSPKPTINETPVPPEVRKLPRDSAQVTILATPGAEVYIDGKYFGKTPLKNLTLKVGKHTLRIVNTELQIDYTQEKIIAPTQQGETQVFHYELG